MVNLVVKIVTNGTEHVDIAPSLKKKPSCIPTLRVRLVKEYGVNFSVVRPIYT